MFELKNMTAVLRVLEIMVGVLFFCLYVHVITQDRGLEGTASLALRWRTRQSIAALGHMSGSPEALWPIFSTLTPFLCVVNVSIKNIST